MTDRRQNAASDALATLADGDASAATGLMSLVYGELRELAASYFRRQGNSHTLQPTALVHEAYLRMIAQPAADYNGRAHFFAVAATAMRQILVDHARRRSAAKRGGGVRKVLLDDTPAPIVDLSDDLLALDESLQALARLDQRKARVVEARFFGGLTHEEIASVLGMSVATVERDWSFARSWLADAMDTEKKQHG